MSRTKDFVLGGFINPCCRVWQVPRLLFSKNCVAPACQPWPVRRASPSPSPVRGSSKQIRARRRSTAPPSVTARRHRTFKLLRLLSFEGFIYASLTRIKVFQKCGKKKYKNKKQVKCVPNTGREDRARLGIWVDGYSNPNCREKIPSKRRSTKNMKEKIGH